MAQVVFSNISPEKRALVSADTLRILESAAEGAMIDRIYVTSTIRTPREQAEAMYKNISSGRIIRYAEPGRKVTRLCMDMLGKLAPKKDTISAMENLISDLADRGERVSLHCVSEEAYAKRNIVDVSRSLLYSKAVKFIKTLAAEEKVCRIIQPISGSAFAGLENVRFDDSEPAIHIEIEL